MTKATKEVKVKTPSLKSKGQPIFDAKLVEREQGLFGSNKEFRKAVLVTLQYDLGVSTASAATMYNTYKKAAEEANPEIGLGRDPKKVKPAGTGKRGRPVGSKNKPKVAVEAEVKDEVVETEATVA